MKIGKLVQLNKEIKTVSTQGIRGKDHSQCFDLLSKLKSNYFKCCDIFIDNTDKVEILNISPRYVTLYCRRGDFTFYERSYLMDITYENTPVNHQALWNKICLK